MSLLAEVRALGRQKVRISTADLEVRMDQALLSVELTSIERTELEAYRCLFRGELGEAILLFLRLAQMDADLAESAMDRALAAISRFSDQEAKGDDGSFEHAGLADVRERVAIALNGLFPQQSASATYLTLVQRVVGTTHLDLLLSDVRCTAAARTAIQSTIVRQLVGRLRYSSSFRDVVEVWKTLLRFSRHKQGLVATAKLHGVIAVEQKALGMGADPSLSVQAQGARLKTIMEREPQLRPASILREAVAAEPSIKQAFAASRFARDSMLYTTVFANCEEAKLEALKMIRTAVEVAPPHRVEALASDLLTASSRVKAFWTDPAFREEQIALVNSFVSPEPDTMLCNLVHARSAFALGDLDRFEQVMGRMKTLPIAAGKSSGYVTFRSLAISAHVPPGAEPPPIMMLRDPPRKPKGVTLLACADMGFFRLYAATVIRSLRKLSPDAPIHFHVIASGAEVAEARALIADYAYTSLSCEPPTITEPYYYAICRFVQAGALLRCLQREIAIVDIDIGVTSNPVIAVSQSDAPYDVMLRVLDRVRLYDHNRSLSLYYDYPRLDPWSSIPAGYLFLRNSPGGLEAADLVAVSAWSFIAEHRASPAGKWWIDQNLLFHVYAGLCRDKPHIQVGNIADIGMPYGYARPKAPELRAGMGGHPMMAHISRRRS